MISFNWREMSASRSAMRLLSIASVSADTIMWRSTTSLRRSLSHSLPAVRSSTVCPIRPSVVIRSRRLTLSVVTSATGCPSVIGLGSAGMLALLLLGRPDPGFRAGLLQHLLVLDHLLQQAFQLL